MRCDIGAGVNNGGIDQDAISYAIEQRIAKGGVSALASKGAVGVEQQASLNLARVAHRRIGRFDAAQVVAGRCGQAEFVSDEIVEYGTGIARDGAMRLVGDHEIEIRGREDFLVLVVELEGLHRADHNLGTPPVVAVFLVNDCLKVG